MHAIRSEYRFPAAGENRFGVGFNVVGGIVSWLLWGIEPGELCGLLSLASWVVLILGRMRAVRERRQRQSLADETECAVKPDRLLSNEVR